MPSLLKLEDTIEITINRIGMDGDGIGIYGNLPVIVPKTTVGDQVKCIVTSLTKDRIHAKLTNIVQPAPGRVDAPCVYYDNCGGCGLQHINAMEYKDYKLQLLTNALNNNNIIPPTSIPWISVGEKSRRRCFIRFSKDKNGCLGFYEMRSHIIIDINECLILDEACQLLLTPLKQLSLKLGLNIEGWMLTNTDSGIDLVLHSDDNKIKNENLIFQLLVQFAKNYNISRLSWQRGARFIIVITITKPAIVINNRQITLPEEYFLQASKQGQEAILNSVVQAVPNGARVLDLFSGLGIYSFALVDKVKHVSAFEIAPKMVDAMEANIRQHNLGDKISAYCRDIDTYPLGRDELVKFDTAIINPPRNGALKQATILAGGGIRKIIMVSCNSSTFARDAKILIEHGYRLAALNAVDQFYYSHHLEQIGVFELG